MKVYQFVVLLAFAFLIFACEKDREVSTPAAEETAGFVQLAVTKAPFYTKYADLIESISSVSEDWHYEPANKAIIYQKDVVLTESYFAEFRKYVAATGANDLAEGLEKHRAFNSWGQWSTIRNADSDDITVAIEDPITAGFALTAAQNADVIQAVTDGILGWNNSPNCRINVRIVNVNQNPECTVVWSNLPFNVWGRGTWPSGNVGNQVELTDEFVITGNGLFLDLAGIESAASHEFGHNMGLDHTNQDLSRSKFICNSDHVTDNSVMASGRDPDEIQITNGDREALGIMYPDNFPQPNLSVSYEDIGFLGGIISYNYSVSGGLEYGKGKVIIRDLLANVEVQHQIIGCFSGFGQYLIPFGGTGRQYQVSIQSMNWRQDRGSNFARRTIYVPN